MTHHEIYAAFTQHQAYFKGKDESVIPQMGHLTWVHLLLLNSTKQLPFGPI